MVYYPADSRIAKQILEVAKRHLIERGWTRKAYARDELGEKMVVAHLVLYEGRPPPPAASYCTLGAVYSSQEELANPVSHILETTRYLTSLVEDRCLDDWNDDPARTKEEVIELFDRAIAFLGDVE